MDFQNLLNSLSARHRADIFVEPFGLGSDKFLDISWWVHGNWLSRCIVLEFCFILQGERSEGESQKRREKVEKVTERQNPMVVDGKDGGGGI